MTFCGTNQCLSKVWLCCRSSFVSVHYLGSSAYSLNAYMRTELNQNTLPTTAHLKNLYLHYGKFSYDEDLNQTSECEQIQQNFSRSNTDGSYPSGGYYAHVAVSPGDHPLRRNRNTTTDGSFTTVISNSS